MASQKLCSLRRWTLVLTVPAARLLKLKSVIQQLGRLIVAEDQFSDSSGVLFRVCQRALQST